MSTTRCLWCGNDPLYMEYHDLEWGKQVKDDKTLFEFLILESAQAGLSWITILKEESNTKKHLPTLMYKQFQNSHQKKWKIS